MFVFLLSCSLFFFFNDTATTEIYTLSLHDALPICRGRAHCICVAGADGRRRAPRDCPGALASVAHACERGARQLSHFHQRDRKSTRLNSSHSQISYAVFCLKKKKQDIRLAL